MQHSPKKHVDKALAEYKASLVVDLPKLARFMKWFPNRKYGLNHEELNREAYKILPEKQFPLIAEYLVGSPSDKKETRKEFYLRSSRPFALYPRPVLLNVSFAYYKEDSDIMDFIKLMKNHLYENRVIQKCLVWSRCFSPIPFGQSRRVCAPSRSQQPDAKASRQR